MSVFLYIDGIKQAAKQMKGDETVHMGIRPYAMHAGNTLSIVAYPIFLCEELERNGKIPRLNFLLSLNDWEQTSLSGEDIYTFTFDVRPEHGTLEHSYEADGRPTVDVWAKKIAATTQEIVKRFPVVSLRAVRNSELKEQAVMKHVVLKTIQEKERLKAVMLKSSGKPTNDSETRYANAVCPVCKHANTDTRVHAESIVTTTCQRCNTVSKGDYEQFSYWIHHKPLFAARWKLFEFTYSISGGDHYDEGDVETRKALYKFYFDEPLPKLDMIFSPILVADDGQKMSKSRGNHYQADPDYILQLARQSNTGKLFSDYRKASDGALKPKPRLKPKSQSKPRKETGRGRTVRLTEDLRAFERPGHSQSGTCPGI